MAGYFATCCKCKIDMPKGGEERLNGKHYCSDCAIATLTAERDAAVRECGELRVVLSNLAADAKGFLSMADVERHGQTNMNVLRHWADRAQDLLYGPSAVDGEKVGG